MLDRGAVFVAACLLLSGCVEPSYAAYDAPAAYPPYAPAWTPSGSSAPGAAAAVAFAQAQLGRPYCWGGNGPRCFDCSGLTRAAWMAAGRVLPRTSEEQLAAGVPVGAMDLEPGDILWRPGHVGLYVGQGLVIAATHTGSYVRYQRADGFVRAVRP